VGGRAGGATCLAVGVAEANAGAEGVLAKLTANEVHYHLGTEERRSLALSALVLRMRVLSWG
jgi:hypothetical protein